MQWSDEAKQRNRRKRVARRLWRDQPLFAYELLCEQFPGTTLETFQADLKLKGEKKKIKGKSTNRKYGRWPVLQRLLAEWNSSEVKDSRVGLRILELERSLRKPYRLQASFEGKRWEFHYPATYTERQMQTLSSLATRCVTKAEYEEKARQHTDVWDMAGM